VDDDDDKYLLYIHMTSLDSFISVTNAICVATPFHFEVTLRNVFLKAENFGENHSYRQVYDTKHHSFVAFWRIVSHSRPCGNNDLVKHHLN
jgi:hypothetical protein